jgi:hypothetical protein
VGVLEPVSADELVSAGLSLPPQEQRGTAPVGYRDRDRQQHAIRDGLRGQHREVPRLGEAQRPAHQAGGDLRIAWITPPDHHRFMGRVALAGEIGVEQSRRQTRRAGDAPGPIATRRASPLVLTGRSPRAGTGGQRLQDGLDPVRLIERSQEVEPGLMIDWSLLRRREIGLKHPARAGAHHDPRPALAGAPADGTRSGQRSGDVAQQMHKRPPVRFEHRIAVNQEPRESPALVLGTDRRGHFLPAQGLAHRFTRSAPGHDQVLDTGSPAPHLTASFHRRSRRRPVRRSGADRSTLTHWRAWGRAICP